MELRVLRYYLEICEKKNITKAAETLHIAQPSLSTQIKGLEKELGVILFERGRRQIKLTENGYFLRDKAKEMVAIADQTEKTIQNANLVAGTLKLGAGQSVAMKRIMKVVNKIAQEQTNVTFQFIDGNADDIEARVNAGSLDFGVIMGNRPLNDFNSLILPERNQFIANFRADHPLAGKEKVTPDDLINYPIILSNQTLVADKFHSWWGNLYDRLNVLAKSNLAFNAALLAAESNAVQITYADLINNHDLHLISRPLSPKVTDPNVLIWKKNAHQSNLADLFLQELRNSLN